MAAKSSDFHTLNFQLACPGLYSQNILDFVLAIKEEQLLEKMALEGYQILAESLARNGLKYMFGVVGIPVVEVAIAAQRCGIHYIGMRNEQAACYAAQAIGKITAHLPYD